jgi:hypothetical protein
MTYIATAIYTSRTCECGKAHRSIRAAYRCRIAHPGTKIVSIVLGIGPDGIRARRQGILTPSECDQLAELDAEAGLQYLRDWRRIGR